MWAREEFVAKSSRRYFRAYLCEVRRNPFTYGEALSPDKLVDRQNELQRTTMSLISGGRLFVVGPRRFGKTSILKAAAERATEEGVPTVLINVESYLSIEALAGALIDEASKLIEPSLRERSQKLVEWFASLRPTVSYEALTDKLSVGLSATTSDEETATLVEALNRIDDLAGERGIRIGIILDEFQEISNREGLPAERQLRAAVQEHHNLSYVFAGSDTRMMLSMISQHSRPFYRLGASLFVDSLPREDMRLFISEAFAKTGIEITADAVERLLDAAADTPYNIQKLAARGYELTTLASQTLVDPKTVEAWLAQLLSEERAVYLSLYNTFTTRQQRVLAAFADPRFKDQRPSGIARTLRLAESTFRSARLAMEKAGILRPTYGEDKQALTFVDPFFGLWIEAWVKGRLR